MSRNFSFTNQSRQTVLAVILLFAALGAASAQEVKEEKRPLLDVEGNQIFSKKELLDIVNNQLDEWTKAGSKYNSQKLDYCIHQMDQFMKSRGYLKGRVTKKDVEETEAGPRLVLTVTEGPMFRVGEITVDEARLFPSQSIIDTIGLRKGDVANGKFLSEGLFERLRTRYAKFGYIQYTAEVQPIFHDKYGASEGVVDFKITIDEGEQFKIRSVKITGVDARVTDLLARELMLRAGDIFDDELFHESVIRMGRTGLVDPIDPEKDVNFSNNGKSLDEGPPLLDLVIHVKKAGNLSALQR
jgi:outer membrane protein assembly factor BamA